MITMAIMKLYLARHGEYDPNDLQAALNARGVLTIQQIATHLKNKQITVNAILHSGKLRAQQTADLLAPAFGDQTPQVKHGLLPDNDVSAIATELKSLQ